MRSTSKYSPAESVEWTTIKIYLRENWEHKWLFLGACSFWLLGMVAQKLITALIAARAIDRLIDLSGTQQTEYWPVFWPYVAGLLLAGLIGNIFVDSGLLLLSKLETRIGASLQVRLFEMLNNHSLNFHANRFSGSIVTQFNRFVRAYIVLTDSFVIPILRMVVTALISILILAFFAPLISLAMFIWTLFFIYINILLTRRRIYLSKMAAEAQTTLTGHLADVIGNVSTVKSYSAEDLEKSHHSGLANDWSRKRYDSWKRAIFNDFHLGSMMTLLQVLVLVMSVVAIFEGYITIGTLLLAQVYTAQIIAELWGLSNLSKNIEQNLSDAAEMTEIIGLPTGINDPLNPEKLELTEGAIVFDDVEFTHADNDDKLFSHFNLSVKPGEKIGLVGHSGSGKTTLARLLLRFSDIHSGSIKIDGQDIRGVAQGDLRSKIAYVPQEPLLFHRTLRENIAYGKPDADERSLRAAAKKAKASEFIDTLPKGYETVVGERGVKLSGGQRQRVAIARAILKDAPILLLDEATSALDSESEKLIQEALWDLMKGRTAIVVAHRLSTIQRMDRIVVMDNGKIIEQGTHKELLEKNGTYAKLWKHQSGGFLEE